MVSSDIVAAEVGEIRENVNAIRIMYDNRKYAMLDDFSRVCLSYEHRASQLKLSDDKLTVTGWKGFCSVRCTHGIFQGTWYCEATIRHLGPAGHCRLGWCTRKLELQAPVGFDVHGFGYRDVEGSKLHKGRREPYGDSFQQGDVIGFWIHMPVGGEPLEPKFQDWIRFKGKWMQLDEPEVAPRPLIGSMIGFSKNGVFQGVAFKDFSEGTYYPTVSLFTLPEQEAGATVTLNFGPSFCFPPPVVPGVSSPARPMCELAVSPPPPPRPPTAAELLTNVAIMTGATGAVLAAGLDFGL